MELLEDLKSQTVSDVNFFYENLTIEHAGFLDKVKSIVEKEEAILSPFPHRFVKAVVTQVVRSLCSQKFKGEMRSLIPNLSVQGGYLTLQLISRFIDMVEDEKLGSIFHSSFSSEIKDEVEGSFQLSNSTVIQRLLDIHATLISCKVFLNETVRKPLFKAFRISMNDDPSKIAFLMARYCHSEVLASPEDFSRKIDRVLRLFRELNSMDEFIENHRRFLSIRLLNYSKTIPQVESEFIGKLAVICGEDEVRKIEKMIEDTSASLSLAQEFTQDTESLSLYVLVISADCWPAYPTLQSELPLEVVAARESFANFYKTKQPNRKLEWKPILDHCSFRLNDCLFTGSVLYFLYIQSVIEDSGFEESGLEEKAVENICKVLVKNGVLRKVDGKLVVASRMPKKRFWLPVPAVIGPKKMGEKDIEDMTWSRSIKVEAAIVMTMKRMGIGSADVVFEETSTSVTSMNFSVTRKDFDAAMKALVEKGYLFVDDDGTFVFAP
jgi:hypothetical protein